MKRNLLLIIILLVANAAGNVWAQNVLSATEWEHSLAEVVSNNTQLQVARKEMKAQQLANGTELRLADPEAEVAYFAGSPKGVPGRTNVSLTQSLDWSVLLGRRKQLAKVENRQAELVYQQQLQQVVAETDRTLTQLVYYNQLCAELQQRKVLADELSVLYQKKFEQGDIHQMELNKIRLNAAVSLSELTRAQAERAQMLQQLQQLNGGKSIEMNDTLYPAANQPLPALSAFTAAVQSMPSVMLAKSGYEQQQAALRLAKSEALPALTVGFQGEYVKENNYSGLSVGFTLPLWGNGRRKVKQAEAELMVQQLNINDATLQQTALVEQLYSQAVALQNTANELANNLQHNSNAKLLRRSLELGQISLLDYLLEISFYYTARTAQLEANRDAQLAVSALRSSVCVISNP